MNPGLGNLHRKHSLNRSDSCFSGTRAWDDFQVTWSKRFPSIPWRQMQPGGFPWIYSPITHTRQNSSHFSSTHTRTIQSSRLLSQALSLLVQTSEMLLAFRHFFLLFVWMWVWVRACVCGEGGEGWGEVPTVISLFPARQPLKLIVSYVHFFPKDHWEPLSCKRAVCAGMCLSGTNRSFRWWFWFQMWWDTERLRTLWYALHEHYLLVTTSITLVCCCLLACFFACFYFIFYFYFIKYVSAEVI